MQGAHCRPGVLLLMIAILAGCGSSNASLVPGPSSPGPSSPGRPSASSLPATEIPAPVGSPTASPSLPAAGGTWTRLGDMSQQRWSFEALELLDGRVFVIDQAPCGGASDLSGPPSLPSPTDLLDAATGDWRPAASLNAFRSGFVAVRLVDGRVLVTGGDNGWHGAYSSTKLFDPATGRWTATGLLNTARMHPVGALLRDGRVLVAGGTFSEGFAGAEDFFGRTDWPESRDLTSAEIYDPKTGRWTPTGSLHSAASAGTAHPLPDGRILAIGRDWNAAAPVEVFDPETRSWVQVGHLARPSASASVVLADGSLLVVGGIVRDEGDQVWRPLPAVMRFDPATGRSRQVTPMPAGRGGAIAVQLADGRILVAGGTEDEARGNSDIAPSTATALIYDPATDTWSQAPAMPFADRPGRGVLLADGSVLVVGGSIPFVQMVTDVCGPNPVAWTARFTPGPAPAGAS